MKFADNLGHGLLREWQILELIPVSKSTFRRWVKAGIFPEGRFITARIRVWSESVVFAWIANHM